MGVVEDVLSEIFPIKAWKLSDMSERGNSMTTMYIDLSLIDLSVIQIDKWIMKNLYCQTIINLKGGVDWYYTFKFLNTTKLLLNKQMQPLILIFINYFWNE